MAEETTKYDKELDVAADFIEGLLDIAGIGGDIEMTVKNDRPYIELVGSDDSGDLEQLIGKGGDTLASLQTVVHLHVDNEMKAQDENAERTRIILDIAGYRADKIARLVSAAEEAIEKVKAGEDEVELKPMNPFERKQIHDVVEKAGLYSESRGDSKNRRIFILKEKPAVDAAPSADEQA